MHDLSLIFFNHGFRCQNYVCNGCYDLTMLSVNINDIAITTVKNVDYCCIIHNMLKQLIYLKIIFLKIMGICKKILS